MRRKKTPPSESTENEGFSRLERPLTLTARVEQLLRKAIAEGQFVGGRLPTEVELAGQLGVSRETVRLAAENLEREGLLAKFRRKGTFLHQPEMPDRIRATSLKTIGYLQAGYSRERNLEEGVTSLVNALMLQGALEAAGEAGYRLFVQHAPHTRIASLFQQMQKDLPLDGVVFASYGEEKLLRRVLGLGMPVILLDHDLHLSKLHSVRDDSFGGAKQAVDHLAGLGHRRIAFLNWHHADLNPWRLQGYRQGLRDAGLPRRRSWELAVEITPAGAKQAIEETMNWSPPPTALYCFNNTLARLILEELRARGLRVPEDISVMGGGGEEIQGLTCHQADWHEIGRTGLRLLLQSLAESMPPTSEHQLCAHSLRLGQTTAAPG